jgi:VWFA-related protein
MYSAKRVVFVVFLAFGFGIVSQARQTPDEPSKGYRFESAVRIIPVPVFVTDDSSQPVEGLTIDDFVIKEAGKSRPIAIFDYISYDRLSTFKDRPLHPGLRRSFLLFFDLAFTRPRGVLRARRAALDFIANRLLPTDLVAVATYSNTRGFRLLNTYTSDHAQAERAIETLGLADATDTIQDPLGFVFHPLLETSEATATETSPIDDVAQDEFAETLRRVKSSMDESDQDRYGNQAGNYLEHLARLYSSLGSISGRKYVLLLSEGIDGSFLTGTGVSTDDMGYVEFMSGNPTALKRDVRYGRTELREILNEGLERAAGGDVVIHALDPSGLSGEVAGLEEKSDGAGQESLFLMADGTGGQLYKNVNDLGKPLQRILKETSSFYLLGFEPADLQLKGRFRKIEVEVNRPETRVSSRRGYYEPRPAEKLTPAEKAMVLSEYVSKDLLSDDVFFDVLVSTYPGQADLARLPVFLKFPGKQFVGEERTSGAIQIEIYGYAIDGDGRFVDFFNRTLSFDLAKEHSRLRRTGIKYYDLLLVRPGPVRLKFLARDVQTGKIGSFIEDIGVPDIFDGEQALTPPVFIAAEPEWIVAGGLDANNPEPRRQGLPISYPYQMEDNEYIPAVRPSLRKELPVNFLVRTYNLELNPEDQQPQVEMKFERIDAEGNIETLHQVGLFKKPEHLALNCHELLFQVQWDEVPLGPALLQLSLTDLISGKTLVAASPYELVP